MKKILLSILILLIFKSAIFSQKREFRAVWVAHVTNIDFPTSRNLTPQAQRTEFINLLEAHRRSGINAIVVQIRSSCDAIYPAAEPWSEWLTGRQGVAPNPLYDPLAFMIEEARKRGMEFHAWFNPYRAVVSTTTSNIADTHISKTKPEWIQTYGALQVLDPGLLEVRDYVTRMVMNVVRQYDIDGVHFDDYFYPYPQTGLTFNDERTFTQFPRGFTNRNDWRRSNIDLLIKAVSDSIKAVKPLVKFGISPFGIWKNQASDPLGSNTRGLQSFSDIYADSRKWLQEGWIDYVAPQLYWNIGLSVADYAILVPWWARNAFGKHVYIGQGAYRIGSSTEAAWLMPTQMPNQIRLNRTFNEVQGSIFFSSKSLTSNLGGFQDSMRVNLYKNPALPPTMAWKDATPPLPPTSLTAKVTDKGIELRWEKPAPASDGQRARRFVVYRFEGNQPVNLENVSAIRTITPTDTTAFLDEVNSNTGTYTYAVTALDRLSNESSPVQVNMVVLASEQQILEKAVYRLSQNAPNPFSEETVITYYLPESQRVKFKVFDMMGKEVAVLKDEWQSAGEHQLFFEARNLTSGVYIYLLETQKHLLTRKMLIMK